MGLAMANNIQKHLKQESLSSLRYWNRTLSRGDPLKELGGVPCQSVEDLVQSCDMIFISVRTPIRMKYKFLMNWLGQR
jgi:3-hydroxyisobutyrate dehydrogenase-like beta-hydroxyacid dehydrogenase